MTVPILATIPRSILIAAITKTTMLQDTVRSIGNDGIPSEVWDNLSLQLKTRINQAQKPDYVLTPEEERKLQEQIIRAPELANIIAPRILEAVNTQDKKVDTAAASTIADVVDVPIVKESATYDEDKWGKMYLSTKNADYKDKALVSLMPIINKQVYNTNTSKSISHGSLVSEGLSIASKYIDTWDPKQSKLATHVTNGLKKLHRTVNSNGPMLHIPEHRVSQWSTLRNAFEEYEHLYGTGHYDSGLLSKMTGIKEADVEKALKENRKVYDDSELGTTNIPWQTQYVGLDLDHLSHEFDYSPDKKAIYKIMRNIIKDSEGDLKSVSVVAIHKELNKKRKVNPLSYKVVNRHVKEIIAKIKDAYTFN